MSAAAAAVPVLRVEIPRKMAPLFIPERYKIVRGGRGGSKSWNISRALLVIGRERKLRVMCAREIQNSIADSVHKLLVEQIEGLGLAGFYTWTDHEIRGRNGTLFTFAGLYRNVTKIKSMEGIDVCWVEEAESVSEESWRLLIPTIRKECSEIWISFNPDLESDATYQRFVKHPPQNSVTIEVGWQDNPWFPDVLRAEMQRDYELDPEMAEHTWGGSLKPPDSGRVYRKFSRATHVSPVAYDRTLGEVQVWCDFNVHAMRWSIAQAIPRELRVLDQIATGRDTGTDEAAAELVRRLDVLEHKGQVVVCGDASGNARRSSATKTDYQILREAISASGWPVQVRVPSANPPVKERVQAVNWHLAGREGRSVVIDPKNTELIADFEQVGWKDGTEDIDKSDPQRTHASDAFGYGVWVNDKPRSSVETPKAPAAVVAQHHARIAEGRQW